MFQMKLLLLSSEHSSTLKRVAVSSSRTLFSTHQTATYYNTEDHITTMNTEVSRTRFSSCCNKCYHCTLTSLKTLNRIELCGSRRLKFNLPHLELETLQPAKKHWITYSLLSVVRRYWWRRGWREVSTALEPHLQMTWQLRGYFFIA